MFAATRGEGCCRGGLKQKKKKDTIEATKDTEKLLELDVV